MSEKILLIGGDARTHALAWKLQRKNREIYAAPGNPGIGEIARLLPFGVDDLGEITAWAIKEKPNLTVVGPEGPLVNGIIDKFELRDLPIYGPNMLAARIEGSKIFSHELMNAFGVPHPAGWIFLEGQLDLALSRMEEEGFENIVIKADGICFGKGAVLPHTGEEAIETITEMMEGQKFGEAGRRLLIQKRLKGLEISVMGIVGGRNKVAYLPVATDNKPIFDPDPEITYNPNTGGMGGFTPKENLSSKLLIDIKRIIFERTLRAMTRIKSPFRGTLYANIMVTSSGPQVLEFNARFGDPETEIQMPLIKNGLYENLLLSAIGKPVKKLQFLPGFTAGVVLAAEGYPDNPIKGDIISGLDKTYKDILVFQAATKRENGNIVTNGGRILEVVGYDADSKDKAFEKVYSAIGENGINFRGNQYRKNLQ